MAVISTPLVKCALAAGWLGAGMLCWSLVVTPVDTSPLNPPPAASTVREAAPFSLDRGRIEAAPETVGRPVFSPTRRPPPKVVEVKETPKPAPEPDVQLVGVLKAASWRALLRIDQSSKWLGVGDDVGRWRIVDIGADHVVLETKGQKKSLALPGAGPR